MSDADALVNALLKVNARQHVRLDGYPEEDDASRWHVNSTPMIGNKSGGVDRVVVLQAADASDHWIVAILQTEDRTDWTLDKLASFKGDEPDLSGEGRGDAIDPNSITVTPESE